MLYRSQVIQRLTISLFLSFSRSGFLARHSAARMSFLHLSSTTFFHLQLHFPALLFHAHSSMICISADFSLLSFRILFTCSNILLSLCSVSLFSQYFITITSEQTQFIPLNRLQERREPATFRVVACTKNAFQSGGFTCLFALPLSMLHHFESHLGNYVFPALAIRSMPVR